MRLSQTSKFKKRKTKTYNRAQDTEQYSGIYIEYISGDGYNGQRI